MLSKVLLMERYYLWKYLVFASELANTYYIADSVISWESFNASNNWDHVHQISDFSEQIAITWL